MMLPELFSLFWAISVLYCSLDVAMAREPVICNYTINTDYDCTTGSSAHAISPQDCCAKCLNTSWCLVGVFQTSSSTCFFKGGILHPKSKIGARSVADMGSRVIKVALFEPMKMYPFNSPQWPADGFATLLSMAQHEYYTALFNMADLDTYSGMHIHLLWFVLIAYSTVGGQSGGSISYWTTGITSAQAAEETKQLYDCALYLLRTFGSHGKTFVFENWEGDWASRAGSYDPTHSATNVSLHSMRIWLAARQEGITKARAQYEVELKRPLGVVPGTPNLPVTGSVYFSAEINLVQESRVKGVLNMINAVIPHVALDMVSYSSYDTESDVDNFKGGKAYFVAEYGMAQNHVPNATVAAMVENVVNQALEFGVSFVLFWEMYDNECTGGVGCTAKRCRDPDHPVTNPSDLNGFWLIRPDGSFAWPYLYLRDKIAQGITASSP